MGIPPIVAALLDLVGLFVAIFISIPVLHLRQRQRQKPREIKEDPWPIEKKRS